MCFIGGRTRYEWWFVSLRLTVIEQSTSSQRREGSPHGQGNSFLGFFFEAWRAVWRNYQRGGSRVTAWHRVIIIHDCQSEIFSSVWSWGWIIYSLLWGLVFQSGIWCCRCWEGTASGVKWRGKTQKRSERAVWLKDMKGGHIRSDVEEVKFYSTARRSLQYSRCMKHVCQAQAT